MISLVVCCIWTEIVTPIVTRNSMTMTRVVLAHHSLSGAKIVTFPLEVIQGQAKFIPWTFASCTIALKVTKLLNYSVQSIREFKMRDYLQ